MQINTHPLPRGVMDQARYIIKNANFIYLPVRVPPRGRMSRLKSTQHLWAGLIFTLAEIYSLLFLEEKFSLRQVPGPLSDPATSFLSVPSW